jgi:hypothetical protein
MRFLILNTDYGEFIEGEYARDPSLATASYADQLSRRYASLFGIADFYSSNLRALGHEARDIFANHPYLQRQWAKENRVALPLDGLRPLPILSRAAARDTYARVLAAQIDEYDPDVVINLAMEAISSAFLARRKRRRPFLLVGQHAAPLTPSMRDLSAYDLALSSLPNLVEHFRSRGVRSRQFRLGFGGKRVLEALGPAQPRAGAIFIGSVGGSHSRGVVSLERVAAAIPEFKAWGHQSEALAADSPLRRALEPHPLFGIQMYRALASAAIGLNRHIDIAGPYANNLRLYETTGVGVLLITDEKQNISELFAPGEEIVTYRDDDELVEKVRYYLEHPGERERIARAGQERTLRDHTYLDRMKELLHIIHEEQRESPVRRPPRSDDVR